jgi:hypothetical protein
MQPGWRFPWVQLALWGPASLVLGGIAGWLAVEAQVYFAPLLLFPVLVGVGLGAMLVGLMRVTEIGDRPVLLAGTVLAVVVAVAGQHYLSYRQALRHHREDSASVQKAREAFGELLRGRLPEPPGSFLDYMDEQARQGRPLFWGHAAEGWNAWASWAVDAILVLAAALAMVVPAARQPYCGRCHTWYRTVRGGRISVATAQGVAGLAAMEVPADAKWARYRLSHCRGGCGPARLELSCENTAGQLLAATAWLDAERRSRVIAVLDAEAAVQEGEKGRREEGEKGCGDEFQSSKT